MTKEELEIDNKRLDFNEKVQLVVKKEELKKQDIRLNKLCFDYQEKEKQIEKMKSDIKEMAEQAEKVKVVEHFEAYGQCRDSRRIADLEEKLEAMTKDRDRWMQVDKEDCEGWQKDKNKIKKLQEENKSLKEQLEKKSLCCYTRLALLRLLKRK